MAECNVRKRCPQCQRMRVYKRRYQKCCSVPCAQARLRARGHHAKAGRAAWSVRPTTESAARDRLVALGAPDALIAACLHERYNAYRAGYDMGRRKGYAEAIREAPEATWSKARRAA